MGSFMLVRWYFYVETGHTLQMNFQLIPIKSKKYHIVILILCYFIPHSQYLFKYKLLTNYILFGMVFAHLVELAKPALPRTNNHCHQFFFYKTPVCNSVCLSRRFPNLLGLKFVIRLPFISFELDNWNHVFWTRLQGFYVLIRALKIWMEQLREIDSALRLSWHILQIHSQVFFCLFFCLFFWGEC